MRVISVIIAIGIVAVALTACTHVPGYEPAVDADGVACGRSASAAAVFITIDSSPTAAPVGSCAVDRGTRITFRGVDNRTPMFVLRFSAESPAGPDAPSVVRSSAHGALQKVSLVAGNQPGEYPYAVIVDGAMVDPVIIIRR